MKTDYETQVAMHWLNDTQHRLNTGKIWFTLTQSFQAIIGDWEESGRLRANHRHIDFVKTKQIAAHQLQFNPAYNTLRHAILKVAT